MATLFDRVQSSLKNKPQPGGPQVGQQQIEKVLQTKGGQAGGGGGPAGSGLAAATAQQQAKSQMLQQRLAGVQAGEQMAEQARQQKVQTEQAKQKLATSEDLQTNRLRARDQIAAQERQAKESLARQKRTAQENMQIDAVQATATQRLRDLEANRQVALDDIFGEFERSNKALEDRKDAAELEQLGFELALSDRSYLDELNRLGRERQLTNDQMFKEEMNRVILEQNMADTIDEIGWSEQFNAQQRHWEEVLTHMGASEAIKLGQAAIKDEARRSMWTGAGDIASGVAKHGAKAGWFDSASDETGAGTATRPKGTITPGAGGPQP